MKRAIGSVGDGGTGAPHMRSNKQRMIVACLIEQDFQPGLQEIP